MILDKFPVIKIVLDHVIDPGQEEGQIRPRSYGQPHIRFTRRHRKTRVNDYQFGPLRKTFYH